MAKLIDITGKALSGERGTDDESGSGIPVLRTTNFTNEASSTMRALLQGLLRKRILMRNTFVQETSLLKSLVEVISSQLVGLYIMMDQRKHISLITLLDY